MNCSKCGSPNCRSYEALYQAGTSTAPQAKLEGSLRERTELAVRCKPPASLFMNIGSVLAIAIGVIALFVGGFETTRRAITFPANVVYGVVSMLFAALLIVILFMLIARILGFSRTQNRKMAAWRNSYLCGECGNVMHVDQTSLPPAVPA